MNLIDGHIMEL